MALLLQAKARLLHDDLLIFSLGILAKFVDLAFSLETKHAGMFS